MRVFASQWPDRVLSFANIEGNIAPEDGFLSRQIVDYPEADAGRFRCVHRADPARAGLRLARHAAGPAGSAERIGNLNEIQVRIADVDGADRLRGAARPPGRHPVDTTDHRRPRRVRARIRVSVFAG
uniref:Uncharacterized protein n=1 Tax=Ralstonia syzygii R24 TaxID=907261 RepID=G3ABE8_9RALS|nr:hypothetical protein RALSY_mp30152 [Ralstonia syzygii R24]